MSIIIEGGVTIESGVSIGAGTVIGTTFNPLYDGGGGLSFDNNNTTCYDNYEGTYSTITTFRMSPGGKYMLSYHLDYFTDSASWVGIATSTVNQLDGLGIDTESIGFQSNGDYRYDNTVYSTGLCSFENDGDVIDLAVDTGNQLMWIRVNGSDWNNDPAADPATATLGVAIGGITNGYFALSIGGLGGPSQFSIEPAAIYSVPSGFTYAN